MRDSPRGFPAEKHQREARSHADGYHGAQASVEEAAKKSAQNAP